MIGLREAADSYRYAFLDKDVDEVRTVRLIVQGTPTQTVADFQAAHARIRSYYGCDSVRVSELETGRFAIDLIHASRDLSQGYGGHVPSAAVIENESLVIPWAIDEHDDLVPLRLSNEAGLVVAGKPGSGKSAGTSSLIASAAQLPEVQFVVLDGKGGHDWSWLAPRAAAFTNEDVGEAPIEILRKVQQVMRMRVREQKELRGNSNFWNAGGPTAEWPVLIVVVDEAQNWTDSKGKPKEVKALNDEATAIMTDLVKKGRSAGVFTILSTQKPTSDALPTSLRDVASLRLCMSVMTTENEKAVLGVSGDDLGGLSAVGLPQGVGVLLSESGDLRMVRPWYTPEPELERVASATSNLRVELDALTRPLLWDSTEGRWA